MRYVLILVLLARVVHADDLARANAQRAAEQLEADAHKTKDVVKWVACGNAYLDLHNKYPDASSDEALYNAAVCFREGKSIGAALHALELLMRTFPTSKLRPRALAIAGTTYGDIAYYDKAATLLEEYASRYAGEKDAIDSLSDATFYRRGLGDRERVIKNTRYLVRTFGTKRPKESAQAMLALSWAFEHEPEQHIKHLQDVLRSQKLDDEQRAMATAKLGDLLAAASCPVQLVEGLCAKLVRDRGDDKTRCTPAIPRLVVVKRTAAHAKALAAYKTAAKLLERLPIDSYARHAAAMAKLALADVELERMLALTAPTGLDFSTADNRATARKRSREKLDKWLRDVTKQAAETSRGYEDVLALKEPASSVAALARMGQATQAMWRVLRTIELPKDVRTGPAAKESTEAFCTALREHSDPLQARAVEQFGTCVAKAAELGVYDSFTRMCQGEAQLLDPAHFPPRDLHPDPTTIEIPMVTDKLGEADWRAGKRDAAIKAWEAALKQNGKLFAPRINLAIARYEQLRALPKADPTRKQLAADITLHAQNALGINVDDPTPLTLLAALALDDPKQHDMASMLLQTTVRYHDKYAPAYAGLGVLAAGRDQWSAALASFERAATLDPKSESIQLALVQAWLRVGRYDAAAAKLATFKTVNYDVELARGVAARGLGKRAEAEAAYQRATKLDATRPEARQNLSTLSKATP